MAVNENAERLVNLGCKLIPWLVMRTLTDWLIWVVIHSMFGNQNYEEYRKEVKLQLHINEECRTTEEHRTHECIGRLCCRQ